MKEYKVLWARELEVLQKEVNSCLNAGFLLAGGIAFCTVQTIGGYGELITNVQFAQAICRG